MQGVEENIAAELCTADNNNILPMATSTTSLVSKISGWVEKVEPSAIAKLAISLGAGRSHPSIFSENFRDMYFKLFRGQARPLCWSELHVEPGDRVNQGDVWAVVHHNKDIPAHLLHSAEAAITITQDKENVLPRITQILLD